MFEDEVRLLELATPLHDLGKIALPDAVLQKAGPLSDEADLGHLDALAARLAPYMEEEYRLRQPREFKGDYAEAVKRLREVVAARLAIMDERCK